MLVLCTSKALLHLTVSPRFQSQWISQQWGRWKVAATKAGLPLAGFLPAKASVDAQARLHQEGANLSRHLPEWSVSTPLLLFLLARWSGTLGERQRAQAKEVLEAVLTLLPAGPFLWHLSEGEVDKSTTLPPPHRLPSHRLGGPQQAGQAVGPPPGLWQLCAGLAAGPCQVNRCVPSLCLSPWGEVGGCLG